MDKISITLREDQVGQLSDLVGEEYDDRSKAVRDLLDRGFEHEALQRDLEHAEARIEDLRRQLQEANAGERDVDELVAFVEEERLDRQRERERRQANVLRRAKHWLFGVPEDETDD